MERMYYRLSWMRNKLTEAARDESGMGVIEIAIIIIVLIAIAIAFREKIIGLVENLFGQMDSNMVIDGGVDIGD